MALDVAALESSTTSRPPVLGPSRCLVEGRQGGKHAGNQGASGIRDCYARVARLPLQGWMEGRLQVTPSTTNHVCRRRLASRVAS